MNIDDAINMMELLFQNRCKSLEPAGLADVLDRLIWCLDDNGGAILVVRERWLLSDDRDRVEIALAMKETYPFKKIVDMRAAFDRISNKWPDLRAKCASITASRGTKE